MLTFIFLLLMVMIIWLLRKRIVRQKDMICRLRGELNEERKRKKSKGSKIGWIRRE